jgi:hypothetical protein
LDIDYSIDVSLAWIRLVEDGGGGNRFLNLGFFLNWLGILLKLRLGKLNSWLNLFKVFLLGKDFLLDILKVHRRDLDDRSFNNDALIIEEAWSFLLNLNKLRDRDYLGSWGLLLDENVAPDLLAEAIVFPSHESEESIVVARSHGSCEVKSDFSLLVREDNAIDFVRLSLKIVSIGLDEDSIFRPLGLSTISESPSLGKGLAGENWVSVTKALLHESSLMVDSLLRGLLVEFPWSRLVHWVVSLRRRGGWLADRHALVWVMAINENWSMVRSPNLKEGMRVNFFDLAFLAKIEIRADTALVANALDVWCFTTIAIYLHVNLRGLISGSLPKVVNH